MSGPTGPTGEGCAIVGVSGLGWKQPWQWMEARTLRRDDGTYLARISTDTPTDHPAAVPIGRWRWEIEGCGSTPEEAEADLRARFGCELPE